MRATPRCLYNSSRRALYRVFVSPFQIVPLATRVSWALRSPDSYTGRVQLRPFSHPSVPRRADTAIEAGNDNETGRDAGAPRKRSGRGRSGGRYTTQFDIDRSGLGRPPQNGEIRDPEIMVIDGAAPEGPFDIKFVLSKLQAGETLRMIKPYELADPERGRPAQLALCKIVNDKDEYMRRRQRESGGSKKPKHKELELTWAIDDHDLGITLRRLSAFLAKGMRVELVIKPKRRGRARTSDEAVAMVDRIRQQVEQDGGRPVGIPEGTMLKTLTMIFEGPSRK
ncbi:hypothetical protein CDD83_5916 [Cordyceps sp. RAO-2017]|nr:hypothetical protein CDD83_5916 [Cordyceps sp. RAO-2017]